MSAAWRWPPRISRALAAPCCLRRAPCIIPYPSSAQRAPELFYSASLHVGDRGSEQLSHRDCPCPLPPCAARGRPSPAFSPRASACRRRRSARSASAPRAQHHISTKRPTLTTPSGRSGALPRTPPTMRTERGGQSRGVEVEGSHRHLPVAVVLLDAALSLAQRTYPHLHMGRRACDAHDVASEFF